MASLLALRSGVEEGGEGEEGKGEEGAEGWNVNGEEGEACTFE